MELSIGIAKGLSSTEGWRGDLSLSQAPPPPEHLACKTEVLWIPFNLDPWNEATPVLRCFLVQIHPWKWGHLSQHFWRVPRVAGLEGVHCISVGLLLQGDQQSCRQGHPRAGRPRWHYHAVSNTVYTLRFLIKRDLLYHLDAGPLALSTPLVPHWLFRNQQWLSSLQGPHPIQSTGLFVPSVTARSDNSLVYVGLLIKDNFCLW